MARAAGRAEGIHGGRRAGRAGGLAGTRPGLGLSWREVGEGAGPTRQVRRTARACIAMSGMWSGRPAGRSVRSRQNFQREMTERLYKGCKIKWSLYKEVSFSRAIQGSAIFFRALQGIFPFFFLLSSLSLSIVYLTDAAWEFLDLICVEIIGVVVLDC